MSTFCTQPYNQIHYNSKGVIGPCCNYINRDSQFSKYNSISDYLNSEELKRLKEELNNGVRAQGCKKCWELEDIGVKSMRQRRSDESTSSIKHVYFTFGNSCNAGCRICNPSRSSYVAKEIIEFSKEDPFYKNSNIIGKEASWYKRFIDDFVDMCDDIDLLELSGGEVFINKYYDLFIEKITSSSKELPSIRIITNGSFSADQLDKLKAFPKVDINLSIDGVQSFYNYIRYPLKWSNIEEKVDLLKNRSWINLVYEIVPHNLNLLHIHDSLLWFNDNKNNDRCKFDLCWLDTPEIFRPLVSPEQVRDKVIDQMESLFSRGDMHLSELNQINQFIDSLSLSTQYEHKENLIRYIQLSDKLRGCDTWKEIGWHHDQI